MTAHPDGTWEPARLAGHTPALAQHLRRLGVGAGELDDAVKRVLAALRACLDDPQGRWILSPHAEARSEWALTAMLEGIPRHVAIDRTFVDEAGIRWIIDYKTGSHAGGDVEAFLAREQERYQTQLETYARVLRLHGEQRPIRLGLYFPLLHAWRTWPAPEA
jgi:ATP-dependent exoDNAse (exonuclease V) beta subunit